MSPAAAYEEAVARFEQLAPGEGALLQEFYETSILPLALERIRALTAARGWSREPVDVLLLTAGTQHFSLSVSLAMTPARFVGFLCTDDSLPSAERAVAAVLQQRSPVPRYQYANVGPADPVAVYRTILEMHRDRRPASVVVDITSGTKAMTAAASSAAMVLGAPQRYVESLPLRHRGFFGREQPHELPHPLAEMGDLVRAEAERLFDRGAFERAAEMFADLHRRGAPGYRYDERAKLARAYAEIDALRFASAEGHFGAEELSRLVHRGDAVDPLCGQAPRLEAQFARVRELAEPRPGDETLLRYLTAYARRREGQGLYDAAALVHYRTIEVCIAARLAARGIDVNQIAPAAIGAAAAAEPAAVLARFNEVGGRTEYRLAAWPAKLGLAQGWTLLAALDDALPRAIAAERLFGQVRARNESIFAHGFRPITEKSFRSFVALAAEVRRAAATLHGWSLPEPDEEFEFVVLSSLPQGRK